MTDAFEDAGTTEPRSYLLLFNLSEPKPEHARLKPALQNIDAGAAFVYFDKHGGAALIHTRLASAQMGARLDGILLNSDRWLIVELGRDWRTFGLDKAAMWFQRHRPQK